MKMLVPIILFLALTNTANAQSRLANTNIAQTRSTAAEFLLPSNVVPSLYQIQLEPNFDNATFNGSISINISAISTANTVVLHMYQLEIDVTSISLLDGQGNVVNSVNDTCYDSNDERQFYTIIFEKDLVENEVYTLVINSFTGILNDENDGFYLATYTDENGIERKLATTQFEATSARRAFPCFDEPALKAEFEISIIRTSEYHSISNMYKVSESKISEGRFKDKFARSVRMSTYLVAFVISDFTYVADENHRVFLRPVLIANNTADNALQTGIAVLNAIADFVNVSFTLDKMDQVGLPAGYFSAGAMENWGLVIYREVYLTYIKRVTDSNYQEITATVISHEFGHQWFGNLVSPLWWTYIWLNEGFATYLEYYGASVVDEGMDLMNQFVIKTVQFALMVDASGYTRPMTLEAGSPRDINALFDIVAYDKSASVIRMVEGIISTEVFRKGLNIYLNKMQFQAAQPEDLYSSWQAALDKAGVHPFPDNETISSVMTTWEFNAGHPLITVNRDYDDGSVTIIQRKFLTANPNNKDKSIWYVPISYTTGNNINFSNTEPKLWLTTRKATVNLTDLSIDDWLFVNIQESGYYRVNYDNENWLRIIKFLTSEKFEQVHKLNRAQLLDDSYTLALYGVINFTIPLNLIKYIERETDYIPLFPFMTLLNTLDLYMSNTDMYEDFKNFILNLLEAAVTSVGFDESETDRHVTKLNRISILTWACKYGRDDCREFALGRIREWQQDEDKFIVPNLQSPLTCSGLRIGNQSDWNFIFQKYVNEEESMVRNRLLSALGCSENENILDGFLDIILADTSSELRSFDSVNAMYSVFNSGTFGRDYLYNYFKENWTTVSSILEPDDLSLMIFIIASSFSTQEQYDDMKSFGKDVNDDDIIDSALSIIQSNIDWADRFMPTISNWFNENLK